MKKRILSMLMAMIMVFSLVPTSVLATDATATEAVCAGAAGVLCEAATHVEGCDSYVAPIPTEEPVPTQEPTPTEEPVLTQEPTPTEEPVLTQEPTPTEEPVSTEEPTPTPEVTPAPVVCVEGCILAEAHEGDCYVCEEGCILEGVAEHEENGWECYVWTPCTLTEGCELAAGHADECSGSALLGGPDSQKRLPIHFFLASPGNITNPNGSYTNYYVATDESQDEGWEAWTIPNIKQVDAWSQMYSQNGIRNVTDEQIIRQYVGQWPKGSEATFKDFGSVKIGGTTYTDDKYEIKWVSIMCRDMGHSSYGMKCQQNGYSGEHIHIDGLLVEKIQPGDMEVYKAIPAAEKTPVTFNFKFEKLNHANLTTPPTSADDVDTSFEAVTATATIPAGQTEAQIVGTDNVTFGYYKLTEEVGSGWRTKGINLTNSRGKTTQSNSRVLFICIAPNGTVQYSTSVSGPYQTMNHVSVQNERAPVGVIYEWKVKDASGNYVELPAGAPSEPVAALQEFNSNYTVDNAFVDGSSYHDYASGKQYTFHGWDTWSHSSSYNVIPSAGYTALNDGDTIPMTAKTYIYGYWTVSDLEPSAAHIAIEKKIIVDGEEKTLADAEDLWFLIDPGIDLNGDGLSRVEVYYSMIKAANGEYKIPVHQYDTPFVFTEMNADVPGYKRNTTITITDNENNYIKSSTRNGDSISVSMRPVYEGENVHLGTVTYTNSYTKDIGAPIAEYPELVLTKLGADGGSQEGAEFKLYSGETVIGTYTIPASGQVRIDFTGKAAGTYTLKETKAPVGYEKDFYQYTIDLTASEPQEELRDGKFVQVTYYTLAVAKEAGSSAVVNTARTGETNLVVYDRPILGQVTFTKTALVGTDPMADVDKENLNANVVVHGPITRDSSGEITDLGQTYDLYLNKNNVNAAGESTPWTTTLRNLPLGDYLVREAFASVHGYTWTDVNYGGLTLSEHEHNGVKHAEFSIVEDQATDTAVPVTVNLTNTYEVWTSADFYIYKLNAKNTDEFLSGAQFTLYSDEACTTKVESTAFTTEGITGPAGWVQFSGFTVPADDADGLVTYYLKESKAPAGYYLDDTVYKVEIKAVPAKTDATKTAYEPKISVKNDAGEWVEASNFDNYQDLLTVLDTPIVGKFTVEKKFKGETTVSAVTVNISGPNRYSNTLSLHAGNNWQVELTDLPLGTYTITEAREEIPGYTLFVTYSTRTVTLSDTTNGVVTRTAENAVMDGGNVTITNEYVKNVGETYEVPTELTVLKVDDSQQEKPLAGAVFNLTDGAGYNRTLTTGADGKVTFRDLAGKIENGEAKSVTYTLTETTAPVGYVKSQESWEIEVKEDNGEIRVVLNKDKNVFENFWDWILNKEQSNYVWGEDGFLIVKNHKVTGELTVTKSQAGESEGFKDEVIANVTGPNGYSETIVFNDTNGWTKTLTGLELGEYSVTEAALDMTGTGYSYSVAMNDTDGNKVAGSDVDGEVLLDISEQVDYKVSAAVVITNTYTKVNGEPVHVYPDFKVYKTDDRRIPLAGATFRLAGANLPQNLIVTADANGMITFEDLKDGTYTLTELSAPAGYAKDDSVYQVIVAQVGEPVERLENGKHVNYYSYGITVTKGNETVDLVNNTLTAVNHKVLGSLTITKEFGANSATKPHAVYINVNGPDGKTTEYTLNETNGWKINLTNLPLGNYVVQEKDASIPGYKLTTSMKDTDGKVTYGNASDGRVTLAVGDLEANFTAPVVSAQVDITNTYTKNTVNTAEILPDLTVYKLRTGTTDVLLNGATFVLKNVETDAEVTKTTTGNGKLVFEQLKPGTYTLTETVAPAGYARLEKPYTVVVGLASETGEVLQANGTWLNTYTYDVREITHEAVAVRFVDDSNTLAVFNTVNEGSITITKDFGVDSNLDNDPNTNGANEFEGKSFTFKVQKVNADGSLGDATFMNGTVVPPVKVSAPEWQSVIHNLPLGEYKITEITDGSDNEGHVIKDEMYEYNGTAYTWSVAYDPNGGYVDITADDEQDSVVVTNTFSVITPGRLDVKKIDATTKTALEGAQFALYKADAEFKKQSDTPLVTYTTTADGIASFSGFLLDGYYVLEEVAAPANYSMAETHSWNIKVERYYTDEAQSAEAVKFIIDGEEKTNTVTLEVENTRQLGDLVINKAVSYGNLTKDQIDELPEKYRPASYNFKVTILDEKNQPWIAHKGTQNEVTYDGEEVEVPANGSLTIKDVPYGYIYSVQEVVAADAVFTSQVTKGNGTIGAENVVNATNTYTVVTETPGLNIVKHDSETPHVIEGAEFALYDDGKVIDTATSDAKGNVKLDLPEAGKTYLLKETNPAAGYHKNNSTYSIATKYFYEEDVVNKVIKQIVVVDGAEWRDAPNMKLTNPEANPDDYEFHVMNTAIKPVIISAEKVWNDDNYYARPESVTVQLLRNGEVFDRQALSKENNWYYVWNGGIAAGLTDEYEWTVEEVVPTGYAVNKTDSGDNHYIFTNTRTPGVIELKVVKEWVDNNDTSYKPEFIEVQLMRDGVPYGNPVELDEANGWTYIWNDKSKTAVDDENINDAHQWSVVEIVPNGYVATYSEDGWTITNTRIIRNVELTVNKVWENIPDGYKVPEELEVVLYKDGTAVEGETRTLTEKNQWKTVWTELKDGTELTDDAVWTVEEVIDKKQYTVDSKTEYDTEIAEEATIVLQTVTITNTLNYYQTNLTVTKEWDVPEGYTKYPESVKVQLLRNGEAYGAPITLSKDNNWRYKWGGLEDCFEWTVEEVEVPEGYKATYVQTDNAWIVVNTLDYALENVSVSKVWLNPKGYTQQPTSVAVVLYRDGVAYETVTLSKDNNWSYKWSLLPDCFEWTVDEPNVPANYSKKIVHVANAWVVTNAHKEIPMTGDDSNVLLWAGATGVAGIGLAATLFLLLKKRKEEDDQE